MASVVRERLGDGIRFHPRLLELCAHYHFEARPCRPARGNEKGRVERAIQYIRHSFFAARSYSSVEDLNRQPRLWVTETANQRRWREGDSEIRRCHRLIRSDRSIISCLHWGEAHSDGLCGLPSA